MNTFTPAFTEGANFQIGGALAEGKAYRGEPNVLSLEPIARFANGEVSAYKYRIFFRSLNGGLDRQNETIVGSTFSGKLGAANGVDHRFGNTLMLSPKVQVDTAPDPTGADVLSHALVGSVFVLGHGSGADLSLSFVESAATLAPYTYSPGAVVNNLGGGIIGGVANAERLFVLRRGANSIQILSGLTVAAVTTDGTMHADFNDAWAMGTSPLNANTPGAGTHIIEAGNAFRAISTTAAIGDQPSSTLTQIADGGYGGWYMDIPGERPGLAFVIPTAEAAASFLATESLKAQVFLVNLAGEDLQQWRPPLPYVRYVAPWNKGLIGTDEKTVVSWHGGQPRSWKWAYEREYATNRDYSIRGWGVPPAGRNLFAFVQERNTSDGALTRHCWEMLDPDVEEWFQVTAWVTSTTAIIPPAGMFPYAAFAHNYRQDILYWGDGANWRYLASGPPEQNPFYSVRNQSGGVAYNMEASGTCDTPVYRFLEGWGKTLSGVYFGGDLQGTASSVKIEPAVQTATGMAFTSNKEATFNAADDWKKHYCPFPQGTGMFDRLQLRATITQGSDSTRRSPNVLPFIVEGYAFHREYTGPRTPAEIDKGRFA